MFNQMRRRDHGNGKINVNGLALSQLVGTITMMEAKCVENMPLLALARKMDINSVDGLVISSDVALDKTIA